MSMPPNTTALRSWCAWRRLDVLGDLVGQFARGQQHQRAHRMARRRHGAFSCRASLQQRQREGGRLAGAGLGGAHHVRPQHHGDGLGLDRRHLLAPWEEFRRVIPLVSLKSLLHGRILRCPRWRC
jgi:hypothetical protein